MKASIRNDETFAASEDAIRWSSVLARITSQKALNIDTEVSGYDPQRSQNAGRVVFPAESGLPSFDDRKDRRPAIGVFISEAEESKEAIAARLAALAIERDCEVIALSDEPLSGLERFGFRTERIAGDTDAARAECIEQIRRFWGLEIIL